MLKKVTGVNLILLVEIGLTIQYLCYFAITCWSGPVQNIVAYGGPAIPTEMFLNYAGSPTEVASSHFNQI
jgi:hypothetical protein